MKQIIVLSAFLLVASLINAQELLTVDEAKTIIGSNNFFGPQEIGKALNLEIDFNSVPPIPFSKKELERARSLKLILILRLPLSIDSLNELLKGKLSNNSQLLANYDIERGRFKKRTWYAEKDWFQKTDEQKAYWALSSNSIITASNNKNYLQQTSQLANYLKTKMFATPDTMPLVYHTAINEWDSLHLSFEKMIRDEDEQKYAPLLEAVKLNQLCRPSPAAVIYDLTILYKITRTRYFANNNIMEGTHFLRHIVHGSIDIAGCTLQAAFLI